MLKVQKTFKDLNPIIYMVGTPIGNLADFSYRGIEILNRVAKIYCEDTRTTKVLLEKYNIKNTLFSFYKFNEIKQSDQIAIDLFANKSIAILSDAGIPCISDPGAKMLNLLTELNLNFSVCPINCGPAYIHAIVMSGFIAKENEFLGFLEKKPEQVKTKLLSIHNVSDKIIVFYESVHRIKATINLLYNFFDENCKIAVCREITKINEEIIIGSLKEVFIYINSNAFINKGEFTVVIDKNLISKINNTTNINYFDEIKKLIKNGFSKKEAVKIVAKQHGLNKAELYNNFHKS